MGPIAQFNPALLDVSNMKSNTLKWVDEASNGREELAQEGDPEQDLCIKTSIHKIDIHRKVKPQQLRSHIKVPQCH